MAAITNDQFIPKTVGQNSLSGLPRVRNLIVVRRAEALPGYSRAEKLIRFLVEPLSTSADFESK